MLTVEMWPIDRPTPYAANPRQNDAAVAKVAASIRAFGFRVPLVVDAEGVILAGHTRLKAAQSLGLTEVPVHVATGLSKAQAKAYRLADNRVAEEAEWDDALLTEELLALQAESYDLALTGFGGEELAAFLGESSSSSRAGIEMADGIEYQIIVVCRGEREQAALCDRLEREGYQCRLLTL